MNNALIFQTHTFSKKPPNLYKVHEIFPSKGKHCAFSLAVFLCKRGFQALDPSKIANGWAVNLVVENEKYFIKVQSAPPEEMKSGEHWVFHVQPVAGLFNRFLGEPRVQHFDKIKRAIQLIVQEDMGVNGAEWIDSPNL